MSIVSCKDTTIQTVNMSQEKVDLEAAPQRTPQRTQWKPQSREYLVMATMAISSLIVALDATILVTVLPTLAIDLHGSTSEVFWTGTSYLLANAVFQPFIAALSDIFGRRELLIPGILLFTIGSALCGSSHTFSQMLVGRVVQGIGGGGIITLSQLVFADLIPLRQRPKYFSIVLGAWALGTVLGPFLGGVFVQKVSWRWCFYINLPICGVALLMTVFFVDLTTEKVSLKAKLAQVDWTGGFLFISSLTSFLIAISWGGVEFAWGSWHTLVPLILGVVGIAASIVWEKYGAKHPFLIQSLFPDWSAVAAYICAMLQGLVLFTACYYGPFYFTSVKLADPIRTGIDVFPVLFFLLPGSVVVSALITRLGHFQWAIWIGWVLATIGSGLLITWDINTSTAVWAITEAIFGVGTGMGLTSVNFAIQAIVSAENAGRGAAMYAFMRALGMALGVAVGGTVFQNVMKWKLIALGLPASIASDAEVYVATLHTLPLSQQTTALTAYVHGFKGVFEVMTVVSGVALLLSLFIRHHDMNKLLASKWRLSGIEKTTEIPDVPT